MPLVGVDTPKGESQNEVAYLPVDEMQISVTTNTHAKVKTYTLPIHSDVAGDAESLS